jgi:hypothetical protein
MRASRRLFFKRYDALLFVFHFSKGVVETLLITNFRATYFFLFVLNQIWSKAARGTAGPITYLHPLLETDLPPVVSPSSGGIPISCHAHLLVSKPGSGSADHPIPIHNPDNAFFAQYILILSLPTEFLRHK